MADYDGLTPGQVLADASVAEFIKTLGLSIAEAQQALDENSVNQIGEFITPRDGLGGRTLLDLGLSPAFYHYQHADISCSLQLSLRVEKNFGVGLSLSGSFGDIQTSEDNLSINSEDSESGSSMLSRARSAEIKVNVASQGALTVDGNIFQLSGNGPRQRIEALSDALRRQNNIIRAIPIQECTPVEPPPTSTADDNHVVCSPNAVAFIGGGFANGLIRITDIPSEIETYTLNNDIEVDVDPAQGTDKLQHARNVTNAIEETAFDARLLESGKSSLSILFDVDKAFIRSEFDDRLRNFAGFLRATGLSCKVNGYASTTASNKHNMDLSGDRAQAVKRRLIAHGVPESQLKKDFFGEEVWRAEEVPNNFEHQPHRVVKLLLETDDHFIWVNGSGLNQLGDVSPDQRGSDSNANGWVYVYNALDLSSINNKTITLKEQEITLSGAAVNNHAENSAEAFALNLANTINANNQLQVKASAVGNVTNLCNQSDSYTIILVTSSNGEFSLSGTDGIEIIREFSREQSASLTKENTGNRAIAVGASLDVRFSRQFEMNVTGNSSISARLVSIPAPPEFLETIKTFLAQND